MLRVTAACDIVLRKTSANDQEDSRGTVDTGRFELWVEHKLVPLLGNCACREPRSVVVMENATIHMSDRVIELIESAGALLLYTAPYNPDMNPIENMFRGYKSGLKRHHDFDWLYAHHKSLGLVTPTKAYNFFHRCGVPGCEK